MYEGAAARQDIIAFLDTQGFEILLETGQGDPEAALALRLSEWKLENCRLRERLAALDADLTDLHRKSTSEAAKLRDTLSETDAKLRALADESKKYELESARQKEAVAQVKQRAHKLKKERDSSYQRVDSLTVESSELRDAFSKQEVELQVLHEEKDASEHSRAEQQTMVTRLKEQTRQLQEEGNHLQKRLAMLESTNSRLENELGVEKRCAKDLQHQQDSLHEVAQQLAEEMRHKEAELAEVRRDLGIALRIQMLRQNDLEELQQRYGTALDLQAQQHQLLLKLQQRLSVAAEYLQQIRRDDVVNVDDKLAQRLVRALTAGAEEK
jgi:chromosome segregation ATPase